MIKQTAVEYLEKICYDRGYNLMSDYFNQAKEMEKEQIIQAYNDGKFAIINIEKNKSLEQYYNEIYKKEDK
jgi:hypothetical protein